MSNLLIDDVTTPQVPNQPNPNVFGGIVTNQFGSSSDMKKPYRDSSGVWHNGLGLETTAEHTHVSTIWQRKCIPFDRFMESVETDHKAKVDVKMPETRVRVKAGVKKVAGVETLVPMLIGDGTEFTPYGVEQLGKIADISPDTTRWLLETGRVDYLANFFNTDLDKRAKDWAAKGLDRKATPRFNDPRSFLVRRRDDFEGNTVNRSVLSERYGIINNKDVIDMLASSFDSRAFSDALASHLFDDKDDMAGNLLLPDYLQTLDGDGGTEYGVGIAFRNSEVGRRKFEIMPFLFRAICLNGCIWGRRNGSGISIDKRHQGKIDMRELSAQVKRSVQAALAQGNDLLTQMGYSLQIPVTNSNAVVAYLSKENGLTQEQGRVWQAMTSRYDSGTAFGIVNALTESAQGYTGETRMNLEATAGKILTPDPKATRTHLLDRWNTVSNQAALLTPEVVAQYVWRN